MELFQATKSYVRQSGLNFQKYYERDQNMRKGAGAEERGPYNRGGTGAG